MNDEILISPRQLELADEVALEIKKSIGLKDHTASVCAYLSLESRLEYIKKTEIILRTDLRKSRVLEIGSGMGLFVAVAAKLGINISGTEPCANSYSLLSEAIDELLFNNDLPLDMIKRLPGEMLPWPDNTFDVVVAFQVLEHVSDPRKTLREAVRVLKPGGKLFMDMPNYWSFIEGHFGIPWFPLLSASKKTAKQYVKLFGRNPDFLNELNMVTPSRLKKWIRKLDADMNITTRFPKNGHSPTYQNTNIKIVLPSTFPVKSLPRLNFPGRMVKRIISIPLVSSVLGRLKLSDHIFLTGEKRQPK